MKKIWIVWFLCLQASHSSAASDENASRVKLGDVLHNKRFDPDARITDIELKAQSGSLSRYSLKFNLNYGGPPVNALYDPYMPNPDNRPRPNRTNISGYMGGRYRVSSDVTWNLSTGLKWYSPWQEVTGTPVKRQAGDQNYSVANPEFSVDRTYLLGQVQTRSSVKASVTTESYYASLGQVGMVGLSQNFKYNVGTSRWILGLSAPLDFFIYNRSYRPKDGKVSNYYLSLVPSAEYKISSRLNFKTSVGYSFSSMRQHQGWLKWQTQSPNQWVGLGWGVTRDIYLNPYLSFFLEKPAINTTSLNLSTVFSIF